MGHKITIKSNFSLYKFYCKTNKQLVNTSH